MYIFRKLYRNNINTQKTPKYKVTTSQTNARNYLLTTTSQKYVTLVTVGVLLWCCQSFDPHFVSVCCQL